MAKYRITSKGSLVTIKSKLTRKENVNQREIEYLMHNYTSGLFKVFYDGKRAIEYTAPAALPLDEYLKNKVLEEADFWKIIAQVAKIEKTVALCGLYQSKLWMGTNVIFINELTLELYFVYQPLTVSENFGNALAVIKDITYMEIKKRAGAQNKFLFDFQSFLNQENIYQIEQIRDYIEKVYPEIHEAVCDVERGRSGFLTTDPLAYEKHYRQKDRGKDAGGTVCLQDEGTVVLGDGETTVLMQEPSKCLVLVHQKDYVRISVDGNLFYMGKGSGNNYCIHGNSAVSRKHAVITKRGSDYYLADTESTNGTFLNGRKLEEKEEALLQDGDELVLADEMFVIELE